MQAAGRRRLVCVITDLTQQLALRREALAVRDQLLLAAEVAELGIWSWTLADNRLHWNARMFELYDQPATLGERGLLAYAHWRERVHPEDFQAPRPSCRLPWPVRRFMTRSSGSSGRMARCCTSRPGPRSSAMPRATR